MLDETDDPVATAKQVAEAIISSPQGGTIVTECNNKLEKINSTERLKEIVELDKNKVDNKESSNQNISSDIGQSNSTMESQLKNDSQNDNEIKTGLDEERSFKNINVRIQKCH